MDCLGFLVGSYCCFVSVCTKDYESTVSGQGLPDTAESVIAEKQLETYFSKDEGLPAIIVISEEPKQLDPNRISKVVKAIDDAKLEHLKSIVPLHQLPPQVQQKFYSKDRSTVVIPVLLEKGLEVDKIQATLDQLEKIAIDESKASFVRITGPEGIAKDTVNLFKRADLILLFATVGLIFILLIVIYRSPLLVFIPLLACSFVYAVADRILGLMGKAGLEITSQSFSIMTILLFASVTDYSMIVFARYREELKKHENKYEAMKEAIPGTGKPVFFQRRNGFGGHACPVCSFI